MSLQMDLSSVLSSQRLLSQTQLQYSGAAFQLSSGSRINQASDDASGMAITSRITTELGSMDVAIRNSRTAADLYATYEATAEEATGMVLRMRQLAIYARNGATTNEQRSMLEAEYEQLQEGVSDMLLNQTYNGNHYLQTPNDTYDFQFGINQADTVAYDTYSALPGWTVSFFANTNLATETDAVNKLGVTSVELDRLRNWQLELGLRQKFFQNAADQLETLAYAKRIARGTIADADMAEQATVLAMTMVRQQTGTQMLQQAKNNLSNMVDLLNF